MSSVYIHARSFENLSNMSDTLVLVGFYIIEMIIFGHIYIAPSCYG